MISATGKVVTRKPKEPAAASLPVDGVLRDWLASYRETLSVSYEETAAGLIRNHLAPYFGARDLRTLSERDALELATSLVAAGKSPALARNALTILRRVWSLQAVEARRRAVLGGRAERCFETQPFAHVGRIVKQIERRHATRVSRVDAWTVEELDRILVAAAERERWLYPALVFAAYTGARRGEVLGLQWDAVDFARGVVTIREALVRGRSGTPKSGRARQIPLDVGGAKLIAVLEGLAADRRKREGWGEPGTVFRAPGGGAWDERNFTRTYDRLRRHFPALRVRPLRFHDLRHTFATLALQAGTSVVDVAAWLGHSSPEVTLRIYAHAMPSRAPRGFLEGERSTLRADKRPA